MSNILIPFYKGCGKTKIEDIHLGKKGENLVKMCNHGINVPPGFIIPNNLDILQVVNELTIACVENNIKTDKILENRDAFPLLVSIRSSPTESCPGLLKTLLNVGLNDSTVETLAKYSNNEYFAYSSYLQFIKDYATMVFGLNKNIFRNIDLQDIEKVKLEIESVKKICSDEGVPFPQDVLTQLKNAILVVKRYIPKDSDVYNAVIIQEMVFSNYNERSATGVCFTRDPLTRKKQVCGEYATNTSNDSIVSGKDIKRKTILYSLEKDFPECFNELHATIAKIKEFQSEDQDIEFTIQDDKLYILQTRDLVILHDENEETESEKVLYKIKGKAVVPTKITGKLIFATKDIVDPSSEHILVCKILDSMEMNEIHKVQGVIVIKSGITSHAAIQMRKMNKPSIFNIPGLFLDENKKILTIDDYILHENDIVTMENGFISIQDL